MSPFDATDPDSVAAEVQGDAVARLCSFYDQLQPEDITLVPGSAAVRNQTLACLLRDDKTGDYAVEVDFEPPATDDGMVRVLEVRCSDASRATLEAGILFLGDAKIKLSQRFGMPADQFDYLAESSNPFPEFGEARLVFLCHKDDQCYMITGIPNNDQLDDVDMVCTGDDPPTM